MNDYTLIYISRSRVNRACIIIKRGIRSPSLVSRKWETRSRFSNLSSPRFPPFSRPPLFRFPFLFQEKKNRSARYFTVANSDVSTGRSSRDPALHTGELTGGKHRLRTVCVQVWRYKRAWTSFLLFRKKNGRQPTVCPLEFYTRAVSRELN